MGWYREGLHGHEGYVTLVLNDGRESSTTSGGGVVFTGGDNLPSRELSSAQVEADRARGWEVRELVLGGGYQPPGPSDDPSQIYYDVIAPWSAVKIWQAVCECGWRGNRVDAWDVEHAAWIDAKGNEHSAHMTRDCPEEISQKLREHWAAQHADKLHGLGQLSTLIAQRKRLEKQIDQAAATAIATGASWAELGRAADFTRQGAMNRWGSSRADTR